MTTSWKKKFVKILTFKKSTKNIKPVGVSEQECIVCLDTAHCLSTSKCNHPICVNCLGTYISVTHNSRMPCACPSSAICKAQFTIDDIAPYVDDEQIGKIWLGEATKQIELGLGMYCPRRECSKPILWNEKTLKKRHIAGKCRSCGQTVCMHCKSAYHTNLSYSSVECVR